MKAKKSYLYVIGIALITIAILFLGWQWRRSAREAMARSQSETALLAKQDESASQVAYLKSENDRLQAEVGRLQKELTQAESLPIIALPEVYVSDLKTRGLKEPVSDLLANLDKRDDLIPFKGIAGGKMRFLPWLINQHWVVAGLGDGHIGGWAILKYEVRNGQISVIHTTLAEARRPCLPGSANRETGT